MSDRAILVCIAAGKFLLHMPVSSQYGYFRGELYYLTAGRRLDFGYVDFPPLIALITALARVTLCVSLPALRLLPALAGAGVVFPEGRWRVSSAPESSGSRLRRCARWRLRFFWESTRS